MTETMNNVAPVEIEEEGRQSALVVAGFWSDMAGTDDEKRREMTELLLHECSSNQLIALAIHLGEKHSEVHDLPNTALAVKCSTLIWSQHSESKVAVEYRAAHEAFKPVVSERGARLLKAICVQNGPCLLEGVAQPITHYIGRDEQIAEELADLELCDLDGDEIDEQDLAAFAQLDADRYWAVELPKGERCLVSMSRSATDSYPDANGVEWRVWEVTGYMPVSDAGMATRILRSIQATWRPVTLEVGDPGPQYQGE